MGDRLSGPRLAAVGDRDGEEGRMISRRSQSSSRVPVCVYAFNMYMNVYVYVCAYVYAYVYVYVCVCAYVHVYVYVYVCVCFICNRYV